MPTSSSKNLGDIPVLLHFLDGESSRGILQYVIEGPRITLVDGITLDELEGVTFSVIEDSNFAKMTRLDSKSRIQVEPEIVVELNYSPTKTSGFRMYPPSTGGWLRHVVESGIKSVFTIQRILDNKRRLLTIVGNTSMDLFHAGLIQPYESSILEMNRDWDVLNEIYYTDVSESDIFEVLKEKPLSWATLDRLVEGVTIPNLTIEKTMEETLIQLVPGSFSPNVRKQIMAFLAWLDTAEIPKEDPIDFVTKHRSASEFDFLVRKHLQCMLDGVEPPPYIRILYKASRGQIELSMRPQSEAAEQDPWSLVVLRLIELFPDWTGRVIEHIISLQNQCQITTELPVSKTQARTSREAWSRRFAMINHGLFMRGHIYKESIGLVPTIYMGGAHRWPHKHLDWSARLGYETEKPQYIQMMVMPKSALERIMRIIPTVRLVNWDMASVNVNLYNEKERKWTLKATTIIKSLERKRTLKQLENEFGCWKGKSPFPISKTQARILDLISWSLQLAELENERYAKYYGIDNLTIKQELDNMHRHGVFDLRYFLIPEKLRSISIVATGPFENICSVSRAFLKHTPSAQVNITERGSSCVIISRVPEDYYYELTTRLNEAADGTGISLRGLPISAYVGYRNNLYSRLIKDDGSWDDDVSGLLSQVRLPSKNTVD